MGGRMTGGVSGGDWRLTIQVGFSMVELMVALAIAAILATIAVPSFREMLQNQRITTTANDFFAAINLTRSEAIQRGGRADLVPAGDGGDWAKGWIVFVDQNDNQKPDNGEKIIFSHGPVPDGIIIKAAFMDSKAQYLTYNGTGRTRTKADSQRPQAGNFLFTLDKKVRRIRLNFLGRPRVCNPDVEGATC